MEQLDLYKLVNENAYPGRGIVLGLAPSGKKALIAYFIMGRSANSRNRVFDPVPEIGGIRTLAADPAKLEDPSLIPSFCGEGFYGLRVHEAALAKGVKVTGATVHFVNEICDGGRILKQKAVEVQPGDTPEILQRRVMEQAEWKILPEAIDLIANGKVTVKDGRTVITQ